MYLYLGTAKVIPHSGSDSGSTLTVEEAPGMLSLKLFVHFLRITTARIAANINLVHND